MSRPWHRSAMADACPRATRRCSWEERCDKSTSGRCELTLGLRSAPKERVSKGGQHQDWFPSFETPGAHVNARIRAAPQDEVVRDANEERKMNRLEGKVAVITGAGSGIGRAAAKMFVAEGAKAVVAEIDSRLGEAAAREAGAGARFVATDVTDEESVQQMVQQARDAFGRIDVLLNCAGGSLREDKPVTEVDP